MVDSDVTPMQLEDGAIEIVENFPYLGSNITNDGELVSCSIAKAFGCLMKSIF